MKGEQIMIGIGAALAGYVVVEVVKRNPTLRSYSDSVIDYIAFGTTTKKQVV